MAKSRKVFDRRSGISAQSVESVESDKEKVLNFDFFNKRFDEIVNTMATKDDN